MGDLILYSSKLEVPPIIIHMIEALALFRHSRQTENSTPGKSRIATCPAGIQYHKSFK
jgi:hypothetical protein